MIAWPTAQVLHSISQLGSLAALLNGAQVLAVPQQFVESRGIQSGIDLSPRDCNVPYHWLFNEYVDALEQAFAAHYLLVGGDALDPFTISRALSKPAPPAHLVNVYGPDRNNCLCEHFPDRVNVIFGVDCAHRTTYRQHVHLSLRR